MALLLLQTLIDKRACTAQVQLFRQTFGESVEITPALCESVAAQFDWTWASNNLLTPAAYAEYERVQGPAYAEYKRVQARTFGQLFTGV